MDLNGAKDGVAALDVLCGRSFVFLDDTNIQACSYRQEEDFSLRGARSFSDVQSEQVLDSCCLDLIGISSAVDGDNSF